MARSILCVMVLACCFMSFDMMRVAATTIRMHNNCGFTVCFKYWVPSNGVGGACSQQGPGGTWTVGASSSWVSATMWAITNTGCAGQACNTGPPGGVTQFEITVNGGGGNDYYDVSKVAGYNVAMRAVPTNGACPVAACSASNDGPCYINPNDVQTKACGSGSTDYDVTICP